LAMAVLGSVLDPIKDRVLRRRLYYGPASEQRQRRRCSWELGFCVQMIKFPAFEPLLLWALATSLLPSSFGVCARAAVCGVTFALVTLPFTNLRMGVSNQMMASSPFKAVLPTVARDVVYAVARASLPAMIIARTSDLTAASPEVIFGSVLGACLLAAPLNELRDFKLAKSRTAEEFFLPMRSAIFALFRGALQAASLVLGYRYGPTAVHSVIDRVSRWSVCKPLALQALKPDFELWALAGGVSLVLLLSCLLRMRLRHLWRSQPQNLRELLMET